MSRWLRSVLVLAFLGEVIGIGWFALFGSQLQTSVQSVLGVNAVLLHALAFALASATALLLWAPSLMVAALMVGAAAIVELLQLATPERTASLADIAASGGGVLVGAFLVKAVRPQFPRR